MDTQHCRAIKEARQLNSQFGYGRVGATLEFRPEGYNGSAKIIGAVRMRYVEPHRHIFDALEYAGQLRRTVEEDLDDGSVLTEESEASVRLNPLLSSSLDEVATLDDNTVGQATMKGNNVLRFGMVGGQFPEVHLQDSFTYDLNEDGDTADNYEDQLFTLFGDGSDELGIVDRYHNYINPTVDGASLVNLQWSNTLSTRMVPHMQEITKVFGVNAEGYSSTIEFPAVDAVGGLLYFDVVHFQQLDNFEIFGTDGSVSLPNIVTEPDDYNNWLGSLSELEVYGTAHLGKFTKAKRKKPYKV